MFFERLLIFLRVIYNKAFLNRERHLNLKFLSQTAAFSLTTCTLDVRTSGFSAS